MDKVPYETMFYSNGVKLSITECNRLKRKEVFVGSGDCYGCSYCYDVDSTNKVVTCKKKIKE